MGGSAAPRSVERGIKFKVNFFLSFATYFVFFFPLFSFLFLFIFPIFFPSSGAQGIFDIATNPNLTETGQVFYDSKIQSLL